jgi:hypothetical protein
MGTVIPIRVGAEWINTFHDPCKQNNLSYRSTHANDFCNQMKSRGHTAVFCWGNDDAWETDFRHPDFGGDSLNWIDNVNMCFYSDHGGNWANTMHIAFSAKHQNCLGSSDQWKLGAKMLKWLILDCCQCVPANHPEQAVQIWFTPAHGVHMVFGFVGDGYDCWWARNVGSDFGSDASQGKKLTYAWLDAAYSWWLGTAAISIAFGATQAEAINRRENETINWRDYPVTAPNWMAWKWRH